MSLHRIRDGFSVMETLVAVALLSIAIIPLYRFQQTLSQTALRLQETAVLLEAEQSALAIMQSIDPIAEPEGELLLGDWRLTWSAQELAREERADGYLGSSAFQISLYEVTGTLQKGPLTRTLSVRQVAWVRNQDMFAN